MSNLAVEISARPKVFWYNTSLYDVLATFLYDVTPNDEVPTVRYVHPLTDEHRQILEKTASFMSPITVR